MKKILPILMTAFLITLLTSCVNGKEPDTSSEQTDYQITAIRNSNEVEVADEEKLLKILENSIKDNNLLLNLAVSMQDLEKAKKDGLVIEVLYPSGKDLRTISKEPKTVTKMQFLIGEKNLIIVSWRGNYMTMQIPSSDLNKIEKHFN